MVVSTLLILAIGVSVARARYEGMGWIDIIAWPSRWLYYVSHGGMWGPTFSACVGLRSTQSVPWARTKYVIDTVFLVYERDHCDNSLLRTEAYLHRERTNKKFWGRPK